MTPPLVSVCIPTHDNPVGLMRTLQCIRNQSYKNIEIIVSDNKSNRSNTVREIINTINDPRIRAFYQDTDIGVDANYQFVFDHANGKYFMFAQDDDWWSQGFIEKLVRALEFTNAPVAMSNAQYARNGVKSNLHTLEHLSVFNAVGNGEIGFVCMGLWNREQYKKYLVRLPIYVLGGDHITVAHAMLGSGMDIPVIHTELYLKGFKEGRFAVCFNNDFWYSLRSWWFFMKALVGSPHIPFERKLILPIVGATNLFRACAITGVQILCMLPDGNIVKRMIQKRFFGAN